MKNLSIANRVYCLVGLLLIGSIAQSVVGITQMNKIGDEIVEIAEQDIPLTEAFTRVTIHQLEQAVLLEKGLAHIGQSDLHDIGEKFKKLGHKVDAEILEAEEKLRLAIDNAHSAAAEKEFTHLLKIMKNVEKEHKSYEQYGEEMFSLLEGNRKAAAKEQAFLAEAKQDVLNKELVAALAEIEHFTAQSALKAEADEKSGIQYMIWLAVAVIAVSLVASTILGRSITNPIGNLSDNMDQLAADDTDIDIAYVDEQNEIGRMARAVEVFRDQAIEVKRLKILQDEADRKAAEERAKLLEEVSQQIEQNIGDIAAHLAVAAEQVNGAAQSVTSNAQQTASQSTVVASASEQASANVQTVAAAAEELSAAVSEIGRQVQQSTETSAKAVTHVDATNQQVQGLADAASKIGEVVALISDIAEQTNLLTLNATIEAARAGEAGKGFAVVAAEVKNLAGQTAKATEEISEHVSEIQSATNSAVDAILEIGGVIGEINDVTNNIAAAVEEQGAATQEIARNVEEAAVGTKEVASNIVEISQAAEGTGSKAGEMLDAANEMSRESGALKSQVTELTEKIRAA